MSETEQSIIIYNTIGKKVSANLMAHSRWRCLDEPDATC